eukprot:m.107654 g.107654  ORF g.107654 m.107654 type:complete len:393 (+) comp12695_c0_seq3:262-1440(+)
MNNMMKKMGLGKKSNANNSNNKTDFNSLEKKKNDIVFNDEDVDEDELVAIHSLSLDCDVGECSRTSANKLLRGYPDGTFLIRLSPNDGQAVFCVIWRGNEGPLGEITHVKVKEWFDERQQRQAFALADVDNFPSLVALVTYYQHNPHLFQMRFWGEDHASSVPFPSKLVPFSHSSFKESGNRSRSSSPMHSPHHSPSSPRFIASLTSQSPRSSPLSHSPSHNESENEGNREGRSGKNLKQDGKRRKRIHKVNDKTSRLSGVVNPPKDLLASCKMDFRVSGRSSPLTAEHVVLEFVPQKPPRNSLSDSGDADVYEMANESAESRSGNGHFNAHNSSNTRVYEEPVPLIPSFSDKNSSSSNNEECEHIDQLKHSEQEIERVYLDPIPLMKRSAK